MELGSQEFAKFADVEAFDFVTTADVVPLDAPIAQVRAREALDFSVGVNFGGYNLYALGSPQTDKRAIILDRPASWHGQQLLLGLLDRLSFSLLWIGADGET